MDSFGTFKITNSERIFMRVFISYSHQNESFARHLATKLKDLGVTIWVDHAIPYGIGWDKKTSEALESSDCLILLISADYMSNAAVSGDSWLSKNCAESYKDHNLLKAFFISEWHELVKNKNQETTENSLIKTENTYEVEWITYLTLAKTTLLNLLKHGNLYDKNECLAVELILQQIIIQREQNFNLEETNYDWLDESPFYWKRVRKESIALSWLSILALQAGLLSVAVNSVLLINFIGSWSTLKNKGGQLMP